MKLLTCALGSGFAKKDLKVSIVIQKDKNGDIDVLAPGVMYGQPCRLVNMNDAIA